MTADAPRPEPGSAGSNRPQPDDGLSAATKAALVVLFAVGLVAAGLAVRAYTWHPQAGRDLELLRASMSILGVVVIGGIATYAFGTLQRERDRRQDEARRDVERRQDESRRDVERRVDERRRRDEQVSAVLTDTLEHWLAVKRIRRELEAVTWDGFEQAITLADYDRYVRELNDHQLAFEHLKKLAPLLDERISRLPSGLVIGTRSDSLERLFSRIEDFLNDVVDEYQRSRYLVAETGKLRLAQLTAHTKTLPKRFRIPPGGTAPEWRKTLQDFVYVTSIFRRRTKADVDLVVRRLEAALLEPLDLSPERVTTPQTTATPPGSG